MGAMRFLIPNREWLTDDVLQRIYMSGLEEIPWHTHTTLQDDLLVVQRSANDSGNVHCPRFINGHGELLLSTGSLMERERPYHLEVELARGTINEIRNQLAAWQGMGLIAPDGVDDRMAQAVRHLSKAVALQHDVSAAAKHAQSAILVASELAVHLGDSYAKQALAVRRQESQKLGTFLAINLGSRPFDPDRARPIQDVFNMAVAPIAWKQIQLNEREHSWSTSDQQLDWCQRHSIKVCCGPLLQLDEEGVPDWLIIWDGDFENLTSIVVDHVKAVVTRYRGRIHLWQVAARPNQAKAPLSLTEQQRLDLVATSIEVTRHLDPQTPVVVTFDQPWAEYMAQANLEYSPLHFADALVRADLGLSGLGLEINAGYHPGGTMHRGLLAYSRMLDRWSMMGIPLLIALTTPSSSEPDPFARKPYESDVPRPLEQSASAKLSEVTQCDWVQRYIPLILSKNSVQVILWNHLDDADPHLFPHSGLIDVQGRAKPALETLGAIRHEYLT